MQQDFDAIKKAYQVNAEMFEGMNFDSERLEWSRIANEFVLQVKSERFRKFIKEVHQQKVNVEK